ncbi:MAG: hypothetical protein K6E97_09610 [Treponema sp.]|nr:hypothetical protein [Treponema sp.]
MKKLNKILSLVIFTFALAGCKTISQKTYTKVDPLSLIDYNSSFYIAVPTSVDPELSFNVLKSNLKGASDSDIKTITRKVKKVYIGMNRERKNTVIQGAIEADVPMLYIPKIFSKKQGWTTKNYSASSSSNQYQIYSQNNFTLSFPDSEVVCLGRDIEEMLDEYDRIHNIPAEESVNKEYYKVIYDLYTWLKQAEDEIRFYTNKPNAYLSYLLGTNLDMKLIDVSGSFKEDPDSDDQYLLNFAFAFKNTTALKAGKALIMIAFGLASADCETPSDTTLVVRNIHIKKSALYKLLVL